MKAYAVGFSAGTSGTLNQQISGSTAGSGGRGRPSLTILGIPATIGYDMESGMRNSLGRDGGNTAPPEPIDPLDRTLAGYDTRIKALASHVDAVEGDLQRQLDRGARRDHEMSVRIARLERKDVLAGADAAKGRRLLGSLLVLVGRRLRDEGDQ